MFVLNVSCVNLDTFLKFSNCAPNKFSVLKHSLKMNKNNNHELIIKLIIMKYNKHFFSLKYYKELL